MKKATLKFHKKQVQSFIDKGYSIQQVIDILNVQLKKHKSTTSQYRNIKNHILAAESMITLTDYFPQS